ncbi:MAG TPA: AgmX/PglI C-terminal domain-containing protein [Polyangiales bacterium]
MSWLLLVAGCTHRPAPAQLPQAVEHGPEPAVSAPSSTDSCSDVSLAQAPAWVAADVRYTLPATASSGLGSLSACVERQEELAPLLQALPQARAQLAACVQRESTFQVSLEAGALQVQSLSAEPGEDACVTRSLGPLLLHAPASFKPATLWLAAALGNQEQQRGRLEKAAIKQVISVHIDEMRACYEQTILAVAIVPVRVLVTFGINPMGGVFHVRAHEHDRALQGLHCCMFRAIARWQFPAPEGGGTVMVTYPFSFEPAG